jgi:hypothetical protein
MESRDDVLKVFDEAVGIFYEGKELFDEAVGMVNEVVGGGGDKRIEELLVIAVNALEVLESVFYLLTSAVVAYSRCDGEMKVLCRDECVNGEIVCKSNGEDREENVEVKKEKEGSENE